MSTATTLRMGFDVARTAKRRPDWDRLFDGKTIESIGHGLEVLDLPEQAGPEDVIEEWDEPQELSIEDWPYTEPEKEPEEPEHACPTPAAPRSEAIYALEAAITQTIERAICDDLEITEWEVLPALNAVMGVWCRKGAES